MFKTKLRSAFNCLYTENEKSIIRSEKNNGKMRKYHIKITFSTIIGFTLLAWRYYDSILVEYYQNPRELIARRNCRPILENSLQYYADINGVVYPKSVPLFLNKSINFDCLNSNDQEKPPKIILFWNKFFNGDYTNYGLGKIEPFKKMQCPVYNCELTMNKSLVNVADYVVVHMMPNRDPIDSIPTFRPSYQRWIFLLYESPAIYAIHDYSVYNSMFNLTATYRIGSDFEWFYYSIAKVDWARNESFDENWDYLEGKSESKMAVALISNCWSKSGRIDYIERLRTYINVDIFGACGTPCPNRNDCKRTLASEYKFYFAFENSYCEDYITEKFFEILQFDVIPVVMGFGPYDYYVRVFVSLILSI